MSSLNLDLKSQQIFGKYLPSVYIGRTSIESADISQLEELSEAAAEIEGPSVVNKYTTKFKIYFSVNEETGNIGDLKNWIRDNLNNLYLYTTLSPFPQVHTALKKSSLDLKGFVNLHFSQVYSEYEDEDTDYSTLWDDPTEIDASHPGFEAIMAGIRYAYTSARFTGARETLGGYVMSSEARAEEVLASNPQTFSDAFYGPAGPMGPFTSGWIYDNWADIVSFLRGPHRDLRIARKVPLSDLVDHIYEKNVYDSEGNPILEFANIETVFYTQHSDEPGSVSYVFGGNGDLYLVAFVGLDIHELQEEHRALYNSNFGDITYEHLLSAGSVPQENEEIFVEAETGSPYNGVPIQTINGKYYIPQPVKQETITDALTSLLDNFQKHKATDPELAQNMNNLSYIIQTMGRNVDLIPQLQLYRKTYPNKSTISKSGKMYETFKTLLYNYNKGVHLQTLLKKQLVFNSKVIDLRIADLNAWYLIPNPSYAAAPSDGAELDEDDANYFDLRGYVFKAPPNEDGIIYDDRVDQVWPDGIASDMYIPSNWASMARQTRSTIPVNDSVRSDFYEFAIEEGYLDAFHQSMAARARARALLAELESGDMSGEEEYEDLEWFASDGDDMAYIIEKAKEDFYEDSMAGVLFNSGDITAYVDKVVENRGMWFFDWEKALRTQSNIAHIFNPSKLERYFRFSIPYKYFKVLNARMYRKEHMFAPLNNLLSEPMEPPSGTTSPFWETPYMDEETGLTHTKTICIESIMRDRANDGFDDDHGNSSIPWTWRTFYYHDPDNLKWGQPYVRISDQIVFGEPELFSDPSDMLVETGGYTPVIDIYEYFADMNVFEDYASNDITVLNVGDNLAESYHASYLVFKNFDVATRMDEAQSSRRMGSLFDYGTINGEMNFTEGLRVHGSYRLMNFEYRDFMDDDVAYYNTTPEYLEYSGNPATQYFITVEVEDRTLELYNYFYELLLDEWRNFIENYYEYAVSWCSYNNITDEFNDFFKDAVYEKYPTGSDWPWVRGVYMYNLYRALIFRSFDPASTGAAPGEEGSLESEIIADTKLWIDKIGPDNGLLSNLELFKNAFSKLLYRFKPTDEIAEYIDDPLPLTRVYERLLELAGKDPEALPADSEPEDVYEECINTTQRMVFSNYLPIDEPIFGDLSLTAWNDSSFTPEFDYESPDYEWEPAYRRHPSPNLIGPYEQGVIYVTAQMPDVNADPEEEIFFGASEEQMLSFDVYLRWKNSGISGDDMETATWYYAAGGTGVYPAPGPYKINLEDFVDEHYAGFTAQWPNAPSGYQGMTYTPRFDIKIVLRDMDQTGPSGWEWRREFTLRQVNLDRAEAASMGMDPFGNSYTDEDDEVATGISGGSITEETATQNNIIGAWFNVEPIISKRGSFRSGWNIGDEMLGSDGVTAFRIAQRFYPDIVKLGGYHVPCEDPFAATSAADFGGPRDGAGAEARASAFDGEIE